MTTNEIKSEIHHRQQPYLSSIILGGFQVFDEPTTIPLGRLSFLFGPNSSGKSAVEDALHLLSYMLSNSGKHGWPRERFEILHPHWRKKGEEFSDYVPMMTLGVELTCPTNIAGVLASEFGWIEMRSEDAFKDHPTNITYRLRLEWEYEPPQFIRDAIVRKDLTVSYDSVALIDLIEGNRFAINMGHPVLEGARWDFSLKELVDTYPSVFTHDGKWLQINAPGMFLNPDLTFDIDLFAIEDKLGLSEDYRVHSSNLSKAIRQMSAVSSLIFGTLVGNSTYACDVVTASRTVPTRKELTHLITANADLTYYEFDPLLDFCLVANEESSYYALARAFVDSRIDGVQNIDWNVDENLFEKVNVALSDYLFVDRGYQLDGDYLVLLRSNEFAEIEETPIVKPGFHPLLVRIYLRDDKLRQLNFDQVGSGLGYVLPVLCSVMNDHVSISLVQQPELHLHPALQAEIGDVFILATHGGDDTKQIVVETHSEHLLLRILKRIRQTQSGTCPVELRIRPEDVSVIYFDPQTDGTTKVKHLRVSPEGDFLDQWPHGFFAERDQELFDE